MKALSLPVLRGEMPGRAVRGGARVNHSCRAYKPIFPTRALRRSTLAQACSTGRRKNGHDSEAKESKWDNWIYRSSPVEARRQGLLHRGKDLRPQAGRIGWLEERERELARERALQEAKQPAATLAAVIDRYTTESLKQIGRTKAQVLRALKGYSIADKDCRDITSADIVTLATELGKPVVDTRNPDCPPLIRSASTIGNYLSHLASIFAIARPAWGYALDQQAMADAQKVLKRLGITAKSTKRSRRPTLAELDQLMKHFTDRSKRAPQSGPMHKVIAFALFSTRRQEEITRITWADFDEAGSRVLVRDMKNPGQKIGNDVWCELPPEAALIIKALPKEVGVAEIFPFSTDAISAAFTRAGQLLGINDLHFHDLRHEGVSRLFEIGRSVPQAASVSGHRSWSSLQRYTHLRQAGDKFAGWKWLETVTAR